MPHRLRLVFIDVDGTLVGKSGVVHPRIWAAAAALRAREVRLAICSGRPAFGIAGDFARQLDPSGWHVFQNGASIVDLATGESHSVPLPDGAVPALISRARALGISLELYGDAGYVVESGANDRHDRARRHAELLGMEFSPGRLDGPEAAALGVPVRAQWLVSDEELARVRDPAVAGTRLVAATAPAMPETIFASVMAEGVDKVEAVRAVSAQYGLGLDDVMFVGDGANDAAAMQAVRDAGGWSVAMRDAHPEAMDAARHTVGGVEEGGLGEALALILNRTN